MSGCLINEKARNSHATFDKKTSDNMLICEGVRFSEKVMIIDTYRENSGGGGPKLKNDLIRIIQDRRMSSTKPSPVHHNNYHHHNHHHHHRRLSNSATASDSHSSAHHNGFDPKSWSGISAFFANNLDKTIRS